ncbi:hypothetical protein JKP88DRAFT_165555, partial [Tribonema minus]
DLRAFLVTSVPKSAGTVKCCVRRQRSSLQKLGQGGETYSLYLEGDDGDRFMLSACKRTSGLLHKTSAFAITMRPGEFAREQGGFLGELRATSRSADEFQLFDDGYSHEEIEKGNLKLPSSPGAYVNPRVRQEIGAVAYAPAEADLGTPASDGPRQMQVVLAQPGDGRGATTARRTSGATPLLDKMRAGVLTSTEVMLTNRVPRWNARLQAYVLNFNGRVTQASVKNFQLVESDDTAEKIRLQFGRTSKDSFTMDFTYPLSPLQAFAITLTSFESK